ncbi:hypothetical protein TWF694_010425 [Orbilia ellipsospora]|uniref:Uncharacterized protein n=1 Tax=Orbilia ellipsospora TaxID=2528407 RepID=A0AAV9XB68_9PEZI
MASKLGLIYLQLLILSSLSATLAKQNLTTYLLSRYASKYHSVITQPEFFKQVLNGTVKPNRVAYFFEQDTIYGRGFTSLCGNGLNQLSQDLTLPTSNRTLNAITNLGETASGLADEDSKLTSLRNQLQPGSAAKPLTPSKGTKEYVQYMRGISSPPNDPFSAFVCSWTMGKAFVDVWTNIQKNQVYKPDKIPQLQEIIDYWADPSYVAAIDETGDLIDSWYSGGYWPSSADQVFLDTLERETAFWVSVDSMGKN